MVKKTISMPEELADFVDDQNLNLSGFVQDKLRERKEKHRMLKEADMDQRMKQ